MSRDEWILTQDNKRREAEAKEYNKKQKKQSKAEVHKTIMKLYNKMPIGRRWR